MSILESIILAIIEGITEFLPVSSTGHMIIGSALMGMKSTDFVKLYTVAIQLGAILSVLVLYWKRFFQTLDFYFMLFVAFIPAAVFGLLFSDTIDRFLESPQTVAIALVVGGLVLLFIHKLFSNPIINDTKESSYKNALVIGF